MISVTWSKGVFLPSLGLALDPLESKAWAFVSHAHSDHARRHQRTIATPQTAALMRARMGGATGEMDCVSFEQGMVRRKSWDTGEEFGLRVLPSGHILGSAMLYVECEAGTLLHTGDFKLRPGKSCRAAEFCRAHTLVIETTYGLPRYVFPPVEEVVAAVAEFCRGSLEDGARPVLIGYSLGKSQEVLAALAREGLPFFLHDAVARLVNVYRELGVELPPAETWRRGEQRPGVLIAPPMARGSRWLEGIPNRRVAVLSGWALDSAALHRWGCDAAFPLSDHADYADLIKAVELVGPERVFTWHGFATEFARDLRTRGVEAYALSEADQLVFSWDFADALAEKAPSVASGSPAAAGEGLLERWGFGRFCLACEEAARQSGKRAKVKVLADFLRRLKDHELSRCAVWLTGRAFPQSEEGSLGVGGALLRGALENAAGPRAPSVRPAARRHGDLGLAAKEVLAEQAPGRRPEVADIQGLFHRLRATNRSLAKLQMLQEWFGALSALEVCYLIKICQGDLRIGVQAGLVEEAIAMAFHQPLQAVREAAMLLGDLGRTAVLARTNRLDTAAMELFRPVACMLAGTERDDSAIWERLARKQEDGGLILWAEPKLDGVRAQLHFGRGRAEIFSRDLKAMGGMFPEICRAALRLPGEGVLDGELLAFTAGRALDFTELQRRLGRREGDLFFEQEVPVVFSAFDCLYRNGRSLLRSPLRDRRQMLEELHLEAPLALVPVDFLSGAGEIAVAFLKARDQGHEGLMLKDPLAPYTPGSRGLAWLKRKEAQATLDVVVVAVEYGHGKRAGVLSDYTFAVREDASGRFLPIGKAYSGLTDAEIARLTEVFLGLARARRGRKIEVEPVVVIEVAFDSLRESNRHASGLAMRFPRIVRLRPDKTPAEVDTLERARALAQRRAAGGDEQG